MPAARSPSSGNVRYGALAGTIGLVAGGLLTFALDRWEGNETTPYRDSAGIVTACRGVIRNANGSPIQPSQRFTPAECDSLNEAEVVRHVEGAMRAVPALREGCEQLDENDLPDCRRPFQIAAAGSLAYNIGVRAFANSTVARRWNAGDWRGGCDAFIAWRRAGGREVRGLILRRTWEQRELCYVGLPA